MALARKNRKMWWIVQSACWHRRAPDMLTGSRIDLLRALGLVVISIDKIRCRSNRCHRRLARHSKIKSTVAIKLC
jgi:hypothetical protein